MPVGGDRQGEDKIQYNYRMKTKPLTFLLALTFLFLFSSSVFGQEEVKKKYWDNGKLKSETHYKNGKLEGPTTWWYENGQKEWERNYKNGNVDGLWTKWYENGQKKSERYYKVGELDRQLTDWNKDGTKKSGLEKKYWDNEKLKSETHYKNGKLEGLWTWWYGNGQKAGEGHYKDGRKHGLHTKWSIDGTRKISEKNFIDGVVFADDWQDDFEDGVIAFTNEDYKTAFEKVMPAAEKGVAFAQHIIAVSYDFGFGTSQNQEEAIKWYRRSAEQGTSESQFKLAVKYTSYR